MLLASWCSEMPIPVALLDLEWIACTKTTNSSFWCPGAVKCLLFQRLIYSGLECAKTINYLMLLVFWCSEMLLKDSIHWDRNHVIKPHITQGVAVLTTCQCHMCDYGWVASLSTNFHLFFRGFALLDMDKLEKELKDCEKQYREGKETMKQRHSKSIWEKGTLSYAVGVKSKSTGLKLIFHFGGCTYSCLIPEA